MLRRAGLRVIRGSRLRRRRQEPLAIAPEVAQAIFEMREHAKHSTKELAGISAFTKELAGISGATKQLVKIRVYTGTLVTLGLVGIGVAIVKPDPSLASVLGFS
jgi:hypothetical protein